MRNYGLWPCKLLNRYCTNEVHEREGYSNSENICMKKDAISVKRSDLSIPFHNCRLQGRSCGLHCSLPAAPQTRTLHAHSGKTEFSETTQQSKRSPQSHQPALWPQNWNYRPCVCGSNVNHLQETLLQISTNLTQIFLIISMITALFHTKICKECDVKNSYKIEVVGSYIILIFTYI